MKERGKRKGREGFCGELQGGAAKLYLRRPGNDFKFKYQEVRIFKTRNIRNYPIIKLLTNEVLPE